MATDTTTVRPADSDIRLTDSAERQQLIERAQALLSEAEAALRDARAMLSGNPELIARLEQQISSLKSVLIRLSGTGPISLSTIVQSLASCAIAVQDCSAEVVTAATTEQLNNVIRIATAAGLSQEAVDRVKIRSEKITDSNIQQWAASLMDDVPENLRRGMARDFSRITNIPEIANSIAINNAVRPETRVAVNIEVEQQRALVAQLLDRTDLPEEFRNTLRSFARDRGLFVPRLNDQLQALLSDANPDAIAGVTRRYEQYARRQEEFMRNILPQITEGLNIPSDVFEPFRHQGIWVEVSAIYRDAERKRAAEDAAERLQEGQSPDAVRATFGERAYVDGQLMRVAVAGRTGFTLQVIAEYQLNRELAPEVQAQLSQFNDPNLTPQQRADAMIPLLREKAPWMNRIPREELTRTVSELIEAAGGDTTKVKWGDRAELQKIRREAIAELITGNEVTASPSANNPTNIGTTLANSGVRVESPATINTASVTPVDAARGMLAGLAGGDTTVTAADAASALPLHLAQGQRAPAASPNMA